MTAVCDAALRFHDAGITVVRVHKDGSKKPIGKWEHFRENPPTRHEVQQWFNDSVHGLGILPGTGEPPLMDFDFEPRSNDDAFHADLRARLTSAGLFDLWLDILSGYTEKTPAGGMHVLFRVDGATGDDLKTRDIIRRDDMCFMEVRGRGAMLIVAPSHGGVHPSGGAYTVTDGGIDHIVTIPVERFRELVSVLQSLSDERTATPPPEPTSFAHPQIDMEDGRPGDDFETRAEWDDPLLFGGTAARIVRREGTATRWKRPDNGSPSAAESSGVTNFNDSGLFHCFTNNWPPFESNKTYSKFAAYTLLHHKGSFSDAAKALRRKGYGTNKDTASASPSPSTAAANVPTVMLTDLEADGMLDELRAFLCRIVFLPSDLFYDALTLYIAYLHTWPVFGFAPRLVVTSPAPRCGKSTLLQAINNLTTNGLLSGNLTAAVLARTIGKQDGRFVLMDEVDTVFGRHADKEKGEAIRSILNDGFQRSGRYVRCEGPRLEVKEWVVFAPVVLAGISANDIPATVRDRAIHLQLQRMPDDWQIEEVEHEDIPDVFYPMRDRLAAAIARKSDSIRGSGLKLPKTLNPRARNVWTPLARVAAAFGEEWQARAIAAAEAFDPDREARFMSDETLLLRDIRDVFGAKDFLPTNELIDGLQEVEESGWHWMNPKRLAKRLAEYGIESTRARTDGKQGRGYARQDFADTFARYLPAAPESVTSVTSVTTAEPTTTVESVTDLLGGTVLDVYRQTRSDR